MRRDKDPPDWDGNLWDINEPNEADGIGSRTLYLGELEYEPVVLQRRNDYTRRAAVALYASALTASLVFGLLTGNSLLVGSALTSATVVVRAAIVRS